jgi:hypothetical protein
MLPGVPEQYVRARLAAAGGNEIGSGKFANPASLAALAANCFGSFSERPELLPRFPTAQEIAWTPQSVELKIEDSRPIREGRFQSASDLPFAGPLIVASPPCRSVSASSTEKRFNPSFD